MKDDDDMPMSGDGSDMEPEMPTNGEEEQQENGEARKREKPLEIKGTLNDVLRAAMRDKPKVEK